MTPQILQILHYLETLRPHQLLEQIVCTAFRAAADTLNQTSYGGLKLMKTKMDQLYSTMASVLKFLQGRQKHNLHVFYYNRFFFLKPMFMRCKYTAGNRLSAESEVIDDLRRLCVVFEHVEKLMALAASLHRKLLQAPRLSEAIFKDYYDFYLPRMGTGSSGNKFETVTISFQVFLILSSYELYLRNFPFKRSQNSLLWFLGIQI